MAAFKWTPVSRQKRVEFKMVTDQSAAEWRCPNSYFTLRFIAVKNAFYPSLFGQFILPFNGHVVICCTCSEGRATLGSDPSAGIRRLKHETAHSLLCGLFNTYALAYKAINPGGLGASPHYNCQDSLIWWNVRLPGVYTPRTDGFVYYCKNQALVLKFVIL